MNSPTTQSPLEVSVNELPEPTKLSPEERMALVQKFRSRTLAGQKLTPEESNYAISLLRTGRTAAAASSSSKKRTKVEDASLEDF
jgi:hypothetical protein